MYTIKQVEKFIAFVLIISMIGCAYPTVYNYRTVRTRQIVSFVENDGQPRLFVVTFKYRAVVETTEKSESISTATRISDNMNEGEIRNPAISPDGKEIVFQYWRPGGQSCNIWAVPTGGGTAMRKITDSDNYDLFPTWSPDGMNIIFSSNRSGQQLNLWRVKSKGIGGITQLTSSKYSDYCPCVSPNGKKIVFFRLVASRTSPNTTEIWTVNFDGSGLTQIRNGQMPKWVGNDKIIFVFENHLWLMNSDGSDVTQLTFGNVNDECPEVPPNGRTIVFRSNRSSKWDIWMVNIDGSNLMQMTTNKSADFDPIWSPGGKYIYFCSTRGGRWDIWRIEPRYGE